jgi:hypothetical protein
VTLLSDRRYVTSLLSFLAGSTAFVAALVLFVAWGGWKAAASIGASAGFLLFRFYRAERPDLPARPRKEKP